MNSRFLSPFRGWLAISFFFPATVWSADNVTIQNTTYTSGQITTVEAGVSITASPAVVVNEGASVFFKAGDRVSLGTGFKVNTGGYFRVWVGPGQPPTMVVLGGNNQTAVAGQFTSQPFDVAVWNSAGTQPLVGQPITFTVLSGGGQLATTNTGSPSLSTQLSLQTDVDGTAHAFYKQPVSGGVTSQIVASSGGAQVSFATYSAAVAPTTPPWARTVSSAPGAIGLSWGSSSPSNGGPALAGYNLYRNGVKVNGSPLLSTNYLDTGISAGGAYTYNIRAVDTSGGESSAATLSVTAPPATSLGSFEVFTPTP